MSGSDSDRRTAPAVHVLFGVILAGTLLYFVPTLALHGSTLAAVLAAIVWVGGVAAVWVFYRREHASTEAAIRRERATTELYRRALEWGSEAHLVLGTRGEILFSGPNLERILGADVASRSESGGLLDRVRPADRRRVRQEFAKIRRQPGASVALEVGAVGPEGGELILDVRAVNLVDDPGVGGVLVTLRDTTPRKAFESELQHLAYYDALTGLANRRLLFEQGTKALSLARRHRQHAAAFYMDLDRFRQVNEALGHESGDALLKDVARALRRTLRKTDVIARLEGDRFAILLTEVRDEESAGRVAHNILGGLPASAVAEGHEVPVGASLGVAMFPEDAEDLAELLKAADLAMCRAKTDALGVQFYRPELRDVLDARLRLEQDMKRAFERHEFSLHYQPVFHTVTGEMVGAEALSRWRHLTRGMMAATEFIALAERSGLIRSLDRWAISRAAQQRKTQIGGDLVGWVAVNLSPQSLADPDLPASIRAALDEAGMEPGALVLELPESVLTGDPSGAADLLWELKNTGAAIALDDYGAGTTALAQLKALPIDILKLPSDLVRGIGVDPGDEYLLRGAIEIAHGIRAKVLAKGVEHEGQADWLRDAGCDFIQGFLVGAPVPAEELCASPDRLKRAHRSAALQRPDGGISGGS